MPDQPSVAPTTTIQQDITFEAQRKVNLIWEQNQARIAWLVIFLWALANFLVVLSSVALIFVIVGRGGDVTANMLALLLGSLASLGATGSIVIGFYFGRTNHQGVGGLGMHPNQLSRDQEDRR